MAHKAPWSEKQDIADILYGVSLGHRPRVPPHAEADAPEGWCELMRMCWEQQPENRPMFDTANLMLCSLSDHPDAAWGSFLETQPRSIKQTGRVQSSDVLSLLASFKDLSQNSIRDSRVGSAPSVAGILEASPNHKDYLQ